MSGLKAIARERQTLEERQQALEVQELALIKRQQLKCDHCGHRSALGRWDFIQAQYRETGASGYHWNDAVIQHCKIVCPRCKDAAYISSHSSSAKLLSLAERLKYRFVSTFAQQWVQEGTKKPELVLPAPS